MHATCPKDPKHNSNPEQQVVHGPTVGNIWSCYICGAEAKVVPRRPVCLTVSARPPGRRIAGAASLDNSISMWYAGFNNSD